MLRKAYGSLLGPPAWRFPVDHVNVINCGFNSRFSVRHVSIVITRVVKSPYRVLPPEVGGLTRCLDVIARTQKMSSVRVGRAVLP